MLKINDLTVKVQDKKLLDNFNLNINDGEIHVIMGHNGIGKSTLCKVIMRDPSYDVVGGSINYNSKELTNLTTYEVAKEGIMLIAQNPIAIEGVTNAELLRNALRDKTQSNVNIYDFNKSMEEVCDKLNLDRSFIHKEINVGASGGERKKIELLHMGILKPSFVILDEIDSGLDVDALKDVAKFINEYHKENKCSILMITHHTGILDYIKPNYVHILDNGKIIKTGDKSLASEIEEEGFNNLLSDTNE